MTQPPSPNDSAGLREEAARALRAGDKQRARDLLAQAIRVNPADYQNWLWLSGAVETDDERRRCLERVLYLAADAPQTVPELVKARIAAETAQTERLYGFTYTLDGAELTTNEIDRALREERDLERRRAVWEASKQVGPTLRDGLIELRGLRNGVVRALGYPDYFSYQTSEYGLDAE